MEIEIEKDFVDCVSQRVIPRISCEKLSYNQFFQYMLKNIPVIIEGIKVKTEISDEWFVDEKINLEKLRDKLRDHKVPVANCSKQYFDSHEKLSMKFSDFSEYWNGDRSAGIFYLKDFHLKQEFPDIDFYNVPKYFASDWLNEFLIEKAKDDYRFIYIGPSDSWTPFHSDVFGSYSWSANIFGRKKWLLLPPGEESKVTDTLGNLPFSITPEMLGNANVQYFELIQEANETLFVPSGWHHQVFNVDDSLSVNHNWFNGCNIIQIAKNLLHQFKKVEEEISDCKDMENFLEHCQLMLKSSFGMNFTDFIEIIEHIVENRLRNENEVIKMFSIFTLGKNHILYDLDQIEHVLKFLKENESIAKYPNLIDIIERILIRVS